MARLDQYLIRNYDQLDSTQEEAKRLIASGQAIEGHVIVTKEQTKPYGKHNKEWLSSISDIALTIILRPEEETKTLGQICYIAAVAVAQSLQQLDQKLHIQFKWVNDILISGQKVCGILLERAEHGMLLVGIGINLHHSKKLAPMNATSLEAHGVKLDQEHFINSILKNFISAYNLWLDMGFSPIKTQWIRKAKGLKSSITVKTVDQEIQGIFIGIDDEDGSLLIVSGSELKSIIAGNVFFLEEKSDNTTA